MCTLCTTTYYYLCITTGPVLTKSCYIHYSMFDAMKNNTSTTVLLPDKCIKLRMHWSLTPFHLKDSIHGIQICLS